MIEIGLNQLSKYYGSERIFENITFEVKTGDRIGLIGQNGCGKTTLLQMILGRIDYEKGHINYRKGAKIGSLEQILTFEKGTTVLEVIQMAFQEVYGIKKKMENLEIQFSELTQDALAAALKQYGDLTTQYERLGGYELDSKRNKITKGLEIEDVFLNREFTSLSGGEKTRIALAKILLEEPDISLLDEPTNHLDLESLQWLEDFLQQYKGTVVMISHDRFFLDHVATRIIELEDSQANQYECNYSDYVVEKERRFLIAYKQYQNQQKKIAQMEKQIERYRIWGTMRDSEVMFKRAKELEKRLEKVNVLDKPRLEDKQISLQGKSSQRSGKIVLEIAELSHGYADQGLFKELNWTAYYKERIGILGGNGVGKTTLLRLITGEIFPDQGTIRMGEQVKIGYLPQQVTFENEEETILEYFTYTHQTTYEIARKHLARVLFFKEDVFRKIKFLSGGERSRLKLCSLTFEQVNLLILDEPTNHLDIPSRENLEDMLTAYEGTILFVSHDRYFINKIANHIMEVKNKQLYHYNGNYGYYLEEEKKRKQSMEAERTVPISNMNTTIKKEVKHTPKKVSDSHISFLEKGIAQKEKQLRILKEDLSSFSNQYEELAKCYEEIDKINLELEKLYEEWMDMQTL